SPSKVTGTWGSPISPISVLRSDLLTAASAVNPLIAFPQSSRSWSSGPPQPDPAQLRLAPPLHRARRDTAAHPDGRRSWRGPARAGRGTGRGRRGCDRVRGRGGEAGRRAPGHGGRRGRVGRRARPGGGCPRDGRPVGRRGGGSGSGRNGRGSGRAGGRRGPRRGGGG